jgi:hypothetical protein
MIKLRLTEEEVRCFLLPDGYDSDNYINNIEHDWLGLHAEVERLEAENAEMRKKLEVTITGSDNPVHICPEKLK